VWQQWQNVHLRISSNPSTAGNGLSPKNSSKRLDLGQLTRFETNENRKPIANLVNVQDFRPQNQRSTPKRLRNPNRCTHAAHSEPKKPGVLVRRPLETLRIDLVWIIPFVRPAQTSSEPSRSASQRVPPQNQAPNPRNHNAGQNPKPVEIG